MSLNPTALQNILPNSTRPERLIVASDPWGGIPAKNRKGERLNLYLGIIDILQCYKSKFWADAMSHTDPECRYPPAFVNFLIKAFRSQDQFLYRIFSLFEAFWKKNFSKKFITRVCTGKFFFKVNRKVCLIG